MDLCVYQFPDLDTVAKLQLLPHCKLYRLEAGGNLGHILEVHHLHVPQPDLVFGYIWYFGD